MILHKNASEQIGQILTIEIIHNNRHKMKKIRGHVYLFNWLSIFITWLNVRIINLCP